MTTGLSRWLLVLVLAACIVGLLIWARGEDHHRGEYVGASVAPVIPVESRA